MKTKFYATALLMMILITSLTSLSQNPLKMGSAGGPAGNGPSTTSKSVTLYESGTAAFTPAVTVTYSLSNQQFGAGTQEGVATASSLSFGGGMNASANNAINAQAYYNTMNSFGSPANNMFSACSTCGVSGINVSNDKALSLFSCTEGFINAVTGANTQALNARIYAGDLTITFNRPVSDPVLQFVGMGGNIGITKSGKAYDLGYTTEFDLSGSSVTLSKLAGSTYMNVANNKITNGATWYGSSSQGSTNNGITRYAASGSVKAAGTNITSITLKVYIKGDGGRVSNGATTVTPDAGLNPLWAIGATNVFGLAGTVSGDLLLVGASVAKPVTVSGNVLNDADGGFVNNSSGVTNTIPSGVYANLIDAQGKLVSQVAVAANGTYSIPAVFAGTYTVSISIIAGTQGVTAPIASTPSGWQVTGEYNGAPNTGSDGTANGISAAFTVTTAAVTNINFGIERPSTASTQSYTIDQPSLNAVLVLNGTGVTASPAALKAVDPEEGVLSTGKTFRVTTGADMSGNKLYYNGTEITGTVLISNYNPSLLSVKFTGVRSVELMFTFESVDAAGKLSNTAVYHMIWLKVLPVRLFEASAAVNNSMATVNWKTQNEVNTSRFYTERSTDNSNFTTVSSTAAAGNSTNEMNYTVNDDITNVTGTVIYYRIKLVDISGKVTYSNTVAVRVAGVNSVNVWPNPFVEQISISFYSTVKTTAVIRLTDMNGKTVAQTSSNIVKGANQLYINNLKNIAGGLYLLQITAAGNEFNLIQKIVK